jgi:hypothetical protein
VIRSPFGALRAGRVLVVVLVLITAAVAPLGLRGLRGLRAGATVEVGPSALKTELLSLRTDQGLLASPPAMQEARLDTTGWTAALLTTLGAKDDFRPGPDALTELARGAGDDPVWKAYYQQETLVAAGRPPASALAREVLARMRADGAFGAATANAADPSADVLSTWAAVRVLVAVPGTRVPEATLTWASSMLKACRGNAFVRAHTHDLLLAADPTRAARWAQLLGDCPTPERLAAAATPDDEGQLLTAVGIARILQVTGRPEGFGADRARLREFLAPRPFMRYDPWWAYYAATGYLAAGGDRQAYQDVAVDLTSLADPHGLIRAVAAPVATPQTVYYGVLAAVAVGLDPNDLVDRVAVRRMRASSTGWAAPDVALWGETLYLLGDESDAATAADIRRAALSCANRPVSAASARSIGICRRTVEHYGGRAPTGAALTSPPGTEARVDVAVSLSEAGDRASLTAAVTDVLARVRQVPTSVLAETVEAARLAGEPLSGDDRRRVVDELGRRHAAEPFGELYTEMPAGVDADLHTTATVLALVTERPPT